MSLIQSSSRYNIINNALGWVCFAIAMATYMLTLEPTASFWDCPEFISQGYKLEVGHPPGNPIFMLAARFFINFAGGNPANVAIAVNAMSGLLSALTILLLFWTITHLTRKLVVPASQAVEPTLTQILIIFGAGVCGSLMYAWSDTFWFSAVEGEVYAFSSFCTALVFWLILKWENRADQPHSDRYLVLIAYIIGVSIAVHLLNLLCIPAIVLVIYYRKFESPSVKGSLLSLLVSFAIVALILFGLIPGFMDVSQYVERFFVNVLGASYNVGVLVYTVIVFAAFIWALYLGYRERVNAPLYKGAFALCILLSGIPFIGSSLVVPVLFMAALIAYLFLAPTIKARVTNVILASIMVIFIGYASYALLLIRSSANPPMNQNEPDNVFALSSYMSREQYGDTPLLYGRTPYSGPYYTLKGSDYTIATTEGNPIYRKVAKESADEPDRYVNIGDDSQTKLNPELNAFFPRIYSPQHVDGYKGWLGIPADKPLGEPVEVAIIYDEDGQPLDSRYYNSTEMRYKPTFAQQMAYFLGYQLNHMYFRYFMWNFAGRQNDVQGNGEPNHGNWISGIAPLDDLRLGDQSLLPDELGKNNKGHNVFYMLPLIMGLLGLIWQSFSSRRGIEQFWVIFFLFFMTGIAIVLYLNQTPGQPRERDYAYAGSFYAYAIWVGMGVPAIAWIISLIRGSRNGENDSAVDDDDPFVSVATMRVTFPMAAVAAVIGALVPLQVVSQTWDDHDRSGRYACRDFGFNYLNSLDDNAIIFTNGDNDTFPLWYAQEVEGVRTDVKVVNLSYLTTDWYVNQVKHPSYNAAPIKTIAQPIDYAYDRLQVAQMVPGDTMDLREALIDVYASARADTKPYPRWNASIAYLPIDIDAALAAGRISEADLGPRTRDMMLIDLGNAAAVKSLGGLTLSNIISLDILASSVADGWSRPVYFASTVPDEYYVNLTPYMRSTGMAYEVTPTLAGGVDEGGRYRTGVDTDKAYRNITERFRWGGIDQAKSADDIYLDETVRRMVSSTRGQMIDLAQELFYEGYDALNDTVGPAQARADDRFAKSAEILDLMVEKLPAKHSPYAILAAQQAADLYILLGQQTGDRALTDKGIAILLDEINRYAQHTVYYYSLSPNQRELLQYVDKYGAQRYFPELVTDYVEAGGSQDALKDNPTVIRALNLLNQ